MEEDTNYIVITPKTLGTVVIKDKKKSQSFGSTSPLIIDLVFLNSLPIIHKKKRPVSGTFVLGLIAKKSA